MLTKGLGWEHEIPDFRDHTDTTDEVARLRRRSKRLARVNKKMPSGVDLREWCSPIEDQEDIGSCTANAGAGLLEYFERRARGAHLDASRLFLYKATRNLLGWKGDQGAYLRTTMKAMVLFGLPPEGVWKYDTAVYDTEPPAFCYAYAQNYKATRYYRLDPPGRSPKDVLSAVRQSLAAGLPSMFGFTVYSSIPPVGDGRGEIPFPTKRDRMEGGHAVVAIGYQDGKQIGPHRGALLIRNSWGEGWGADGYGWLPYEYLLGGLASDFWTLLHAEYVDTELFE
jgi:C1A family cysteine protease